MRVFNAPIKNWLYFAYRLLLPIVDPVRFLKGVSGYPWYVRDLLKFQLKSPEAALWGRNMYPILDEKVSTTPFDSHYFYQEIWAFKHLLQNRPKRHVDIASKYQFSGFVSLLTKSEFVDIRPIPASLRNLTVVPGDVLHLPYFDKSLVSVSSLHVIEHIGLGRYGDPIDPDGTVKACKELVRVLARGGLLYVSVPIGRYRICFNAHRVHTPDQIISYLKPLELIEFSVVNDDGEFHENVAYQKYRNQWYGCGMFLFRKPNK